MHMLRSFKITKPKKPWNSRWMRRSCPCLLSESTLKSLNFLELTLVQQKVRLSTESGGYRQSWRLGEWTFERTHSPRAAFSSWMDGWVGMAMVSPRVWWGHGRPRGGRRRQGGWGDRVVAATAWPARVPPWTPALAGGEAEPPGSRSSSFEVCHRSGTPRGPGLS